MPWLLDGSFQRVTNNTTEESPDKLWQQDLEASIKIIATRHDFHDHDIAQGIEGCLSLNGYNKMLANLDMNQFRIINLADATGNADLPTYGQCIGSLTFDTPNPGDLSIVDRDGNTVDTVNIPTGGGGNPGTVTAITIGGGLTGSPNPIQTTGTIALETLGVGQTYSGGVSSITLDNYGRVTQVVTGAFANTNLGNNPAPENVEVTSSTGNNTTIPAAIASGNAGVMTGVMAQQLADLVAAGTGGGMIPPIELNGINETPQDGLVQAVEDWTQKYTDGVSGFSWQNLISLTGSGLINYLGICMAGLSTSARIDARLLIDGVEVWALDDLFVQGVTVNDSGINLVGEVDAATTDLKAFQQIKFNSSLQLQTRSSQTNSSSIEGYIRWQRYTN